MTTIFVEEDLKLTNLRFKSRKELLPTLLEDYEDLVLGSEMQSLVSGSSEKDFMSYANFLSKYS